MEDDSGFQKNISVDPSSSSVNNLILDYYKKFGRKRDLEQFFSLSTAQSEIRDPSGTFWRKMKSQNDSSDSGEKMSESSTELCRISIKCSMPEPSSSQKKAYEEHQNSDSESPPIIAEDAALRSSKNSDEESAKSEDVQSHRSNDATLDTSINKPLSPTSSITSQRKLEWDSLADVGYANESDRKTSASSLSTLERLALKQQYSHNDTNHNIELGPPTSHSTPVEVIETKSKGKKGLIKKTTKFYQKDVDLVELNVPHNSQTNLPQAISVNLSKHICFNVEKSGEINIENIEKNISVSPEKYVPSSPPIQDKLDKEIQTSHFVNNDKTHSLKKVSMDNLFNTEKYPVLITLNTLKTRNRKRKLRLAKKNLRKRNKLKIDNENISKEKATEQVSEAESFEYMPGHIYNQNHLKINQSRGTHIDNKSSLESSAGLTTDSSKGTKQSFSKDLEKSIDLLKSVLQQHSNDSTLKKKLIKEVVQRLIKSKYKDDESSTDFLSGLSYNSKIIGEANHTTSSTSDANIEYKSKSTRPKKSILQTTKFNSNAIASTSQSAPNLASVYNSEKLATSDLANSVFISNTDSELSSKEKNSSDVGVAKTSEEFYKKYLQALKREECYKKHLKDKENLKQKLVSSDTALAQLAQADLKTRSKLKSLVKDLTRNNYNDGSGDASKLEGHSNSNKCMEPHIFLNNHNSHSVFTLSSGHDEGQNKNPRFKNIIKIRGNSSKAGSSKNQHHFCCCPYHADHPDIGFIDSSVQVNIKSDEATEKPGTENKLCKMNCQCTKCKKDTTKNITKVVSDSETGDLKYICVCPEEGESKKVPENLLVYKCSRLVDKSVQLGDSLTRSLSNENYQQNKEIYTCCDHSNKTPKVFLKQNVISSNMPQNSKSSQTNVNLNLMIQQKPSVKSVCSQFSGSTDEVNTVESEKYGPKLCIQEAIRSIQTEISINPKLSDPCLTDIKVIDDSECVKLIKEQFKFISKSNSENNTDDLISDNKYPPSSGNSSTKVTSKVSTENFNKSKNSLEYAYIAKLDKEIQSDLGLVDNNKNENFTEQFTIPIQGTNMTLKVNLGTKPNEKSNDIAIKSQGVVTEKPNFVERFTSLREDCTKSVQCCDANVFQQMKMDDTEQNIEDKNANKDEEPFISTRLVNTCLADKHKYSTYPIKDHICSRKPMLRTNTDINNIDNLYSLPIDIKKYDDIINKSSKGSDEPIGQQMTKFNEHDKKIIRDQPTTTANQSDKCASCSIKSNLINLTTKSNDGNQAEKFQNCSNQIASSKQPMKVDQHNQHGKCTACFNQTVITDQPLRSVTQNQPKKITESPQQIDLKDQPNKQNQSRKCTTCSNPKDLPELPTKSHNQNQSEMYLTCSSKCSKGNGASRKEEELKSRTPSKTSMSESEGHHEYDPNQDPILDMIEGITKRYSKKDIEKSNRKKCFKEIMNVLNYLLETEDGVDGQNKKLSNNISSASYEKKNEVPSKKNTQIESRPSKTFVDKGVQLCTNKSKSNKLHNSESSEIIVTSEHVTTSSDSATCKVLNKIKKECEKYHQKRCKSHNGLKPCETSSTTSVNCDHCKRVHHCHCVRYKCRTHKTKICAEKLKKKCVAYNLILQTSDSVVSEETLPANNRPLKSIIVKVPSKRKQAENVPFKEMAAKLERNIPSCSPHSPYRGHRSRSLPNESETSNTDEFLRKPQIYTVREYLERNRPDFVQKSSKRQDCLKMINETRQEMCPSPYFKMVVVHTPKCVAGSCLDPCNMYCGGGVPHPCNQCLDPYVHMQNEVTRIATERHAKRKLLSLQLAKQQTLSALTDEELRHFAKQLSEELRRKKVAPKFISEREMKKHSEKIYKSLPEVTRKKEELKKENIKKTNLLMANIFKKNLQKKTLGGSVNLSNYSTVIKI